MRAKYAREIRRGITFGRLHAQARDSGWHTAAFVMTLTFVQGHGELAIRAYKRSLAPRQACGNKSTGEPNG